MKKRFAVSFIAVLMVLCMSACSVNLPFMNKDKEDAEEYDVNPAAGRVRVSESLVYTVGDTIQVNDVLEVQLEYAEQVSQMVFINGSTVTDSIVASEAGQFSVQCVVEFMDGESWGGTYEYIVEEPDVSLSRETMDCINLKTWDTTTLQTDDGKQCVISYCSDEHMFNVVRLSSGESFEFSFNYGTDTQMKSHDISFISIDEEMQLAEQDWSPLRTDVGTKTMCALMTSLLGLVEDGEGWVNSETGEPATEDEVRTAQMMIYYYTDVIMSSVSVKTEYAGYSLETMSGDEVQMNRVVQVFTDKAGNEYKAYPYYYCRPTEDTILILPGSSRLNISAEVPEAVGSTDDEIKEGIRNGIVVEESIPAGAINLDGFVHEFVIGDASALFPEYDTVVVGGSGSEEELPDEVQGTAGNNYLTYQQRHPEVYTWSDPDTKSYRRYITDPILTEAGFVGLIILEDGTWVIGGGEVYEPEQIGGGTGSSSGSSPTGTTSYTLTSSYGNYTIDTRDVSVDGKKAAIDTDASTSGKVKVILEGNKVYYIEVARVSNISTYIANSIYGTDSYADGEFEVSENTAGVITTAKGRITPYTIEYMNKNGREVKCDYMAVYNINNDYLICYGEKIPDDGVCVAMLQQYVK